MNLGFVGNLLRRCTGNQAASEKSAYECFDTVVRSVGAPNLALGLAAAFRSDQTPPFAHLVSQMFADGSAEEKAGMLNSLLLDAPPALVSETGSLLPASGVPITPDQAAVVAAASVQELAAHAEKHDPSVTYRLSSFCAEHPLLAKSLGAAAMAVATRTIAKRYS